MKGHYYIEIADNTRSYIDIFNDKDIFDDTKIGPDTFVLRRRTLICLMA